MERVWIMYEMDTSKQVKEIKYFFTISYSLARSFFLRSSNPENWQTRKNRNEL